LQSWPELLAYNSGKQGPKALYPEPLYPALWVIHDMDKQALPILILDREDDTHDVEFWNTKTPEERLDAVEFLREQCYLAMGIQEAPRLVRELRVVEK